ncbi:transcriptional regulator [Paractinoplanes toevensis]|uniref:MarR family transcriptional regulator n=1 Tax=Paractinoplanes toevensis TaxID=571911 RepID=A0A919W878_9ACTN|nr:transcriptional regulator [Actinoplanes toevensis]GIM92436.1 MarR family transcriptional regulator [Actinoplanes toevensis]
MTPAHFDELIHAPNRLQICGLAAATEYVEFAMLRDLLGISDSALSKHLAVLENAGYVRLRKAMGDSRIRTWVSLTHLGRRAFDQHIAALQAIAAGKPVLNTTHTSG